MQGPDSAYLQVPVQKMPSVKENYGLPLGLSSKESSCKAGAVRDRSWVGKIPWKREWQPTQAFLPGESHGHRSLEGDSPRSHKELDTTEACMHTENYPTQSHFTFLGPTHIHKLFHVAV